MPCKCNVNRVHEADHLLPFICRQIPFTCEVICTPLRSMQQPCAVWEQERSGSVLPHSLWSHTWKSAFPGFSASVSSGLSENAPENPASACALTDSAWRWPTVDLWMTWEKGRQWRDSCFQLDTHTHTHGCDTTYIHVFNIHLCLLLQLCDNLPVEPL